MPAGIRANICDYRKERVDILVAVEAVLESGRLILDKCVRGSGRTRAAPLRADLIRTIEWSWRTLMPTPAARRAQGGVPRLLSAHFE